MSKLSTREEKIQKYAPKTAGSCGPKCKQLCNIDGKIEAKHELDVCIDRWHGAKPDDVARKECLKGKDPVRFNEHNAKYKVTKKLGTNTPTNETKGCFKKYEQGYALELSRLKRNINTPIIVPKHLIVSPLAETFQARKAEKIEQENERIVRVKLRGERCTVASGCVKLVTDPHLETKIPLGEFYPTKFHCEDKRGFLSISSPETIKFALRKLIGNNKTCVITDQIIEQRLETSPVTSKPDKNPVYTIKT